MTWFLFLIIYLITTLVTLLIFGIVGGIITGIKTKFIKSKFIQQIVAVIQVVNESLFSVFSSVNLLTVVVVLILFEITSPVIFGFLSGIMLSTFLYEPTKWYLRDILGDISSSQMMLLGASYEKFILYIILYSGYIRRVLIPSILNNFVYALGMWMTVSVIKNRAFESIGKYMKVWIAPDYPYTEIFMVLAFLMIEVFLLVFNSRNIVAEKNEVNYKNDGTSDDSVLLKVNKGSWIKDREGWKLDILNDDFILNKGEVVWLRGDSGSGKSIFAKAIMDILPFNFRASLKGKVNNKKYFYVYQEPAVFLFPYMSIGKFVIENGIDEKEIKNMIDNWENIKKRFPVKANAGAKRWIGVAIAKQVVNTEENDYRLVIFDEPDASLDIVNQKKMLEIIKKDFYDKGKSIIYISHNVYIGKKMKSVYGENFKVYEITSGQLRKNTNGVNVNMNLKKKECKQNNVEFIVKGLIVDKVRIERKPILKGVNMEIESSRKVKFLIGRNGRGKSVFLRSLVALIERRVEEECISLDKYKWNLTKSSTRDISPKFLLLIQDDIERSFPAWLTIKRSISLLGINSLNKQFQSWESKKFIQLSGGQRQTLMLKEILPDILKKFGNNNIPVVLLDEPFSRLNYSLLTDMMDFIITTPYKFIIVTHNLLLVEQMRQFYASESCNSSIDISFEPIDPDGKSIIEKAKKYFIEE